MTSEDHKGVPESGCWRQPGRVWYSVSFAAALLERERAQASGSHADAMLQIITRPLSSAYQKPNNNASLCSPFLPPGLPRYGQMKGTGQSVNTSGSVDSVKECATGKVTRCGASERRPHHHPWYFTERPRLGGHAKALAPQLCPFLLTLWGKKKRKRWSMTDLVPKVTDYLSNAVSNWKLHQRLQNPTTSRVEGSGGGGRIPAERRAEAAGSLMNHGDEPTLSTRSRCGV